MQRPSPIQPELQYLTLLHHQAQQLKMGAGYPRSQQAGQHRSRFRGQGMEFEESRLYQPGDEIRNMDWRVTARTSKPHIKVFREDRERPAWLMLDLRAPMFFATRGALKSVVALECASLLGWSILHHGDRVGGMLLGDLQSKLIKPAHGRKSIMRLMGQAIELHDSRLEEQQNGQQAANPFSTTEHADASLFTSVQRLNHQAHGGSLLMLVSDARGLDEATVLLLRQSMRHHQVVFVHVHDPFESALAEVGILPVTDGQHRGELDTGNRETLSRYHALFRARQQRLEKLAEHPNFFLISCSTAEQPFEVLFRHLGQRR